MTDLRKIHHNENQNTHIHRHLLLPVIYHSIVYTTMTDHSIVASVSVAAAAALDSDEANFSVTEAMVSFLRTEANQADARAKRLRKQAFELARQFGITEESQQSYGINPNDLPPLDENGLPKYKGKKRGRKPKEKKRKFNPDRPKRSHTGYTLFMQEGYPSAKTEFPNLTSKELISLVARRWKDLTAEARAEWKERAKQQAPNIASGGDSNPSNADIIDELLE